MKKFLILLLVKWKNTYIIYRNVFIIFHRVFVPRWELVGVAIIHYVEVGA